MTNFEQVGSEEEFLDTYQEKKSEYPSFAFTSDIVLMTIKDNELSVLLVKRSNHPYKDCWALPGGFVEIDESSEDAAVRELEEETGIHIDSMYMEQLKTYSAPNRDPRMRIVSSAYIALIPHDALDAPDAGSDATDAQWFSVHGISENINLAFDHETILYDGLERVQSKLEYTSLATAFLGKTFTLADLRKIYEEVWNKKLHAANFRRKILSVNNLVEEVGMKGSSKFSDGNSALLYTSGTAHMLMPPLMRDTE